MVRACGSISKVKEAKEDNGDVPRGLKPLPLILETLPTFSPFVSPPFWTPPRPFQLPKQATPFEEAGRSALLVSCSDSYSAPHATGRSARQSL